MNSTKSVDLKRLAEVLDIYGADAHRWPKTQRDELSALCRRNVQAATLLKEAKRLDEVLALAPRGQCATQLQARIAAHAAPGKSDFPELKIIPAGVEKKARPSRKSYSIAWPLVGALAASFAIGIFLGASGLSDGVLEDAIQLAFGAQFDVPIEDAGPFAGTLLNEELL